MSPKTVPSKGLREKLKHFFTWKFMILNPKCSHAVLIKIDSTDWLHTHLGNGYKIPLYMCNTCGIKLQVQASLNRIA